MSYIVLARKYRPNSFGDMVGQEHVVRTLRNAIARNRVHHAYVFTGARGVGKTTAARLLARTLNCAAAPAASGSKASDQTASDQTIEACGVCTSCREITGGSSPDVLEIDAASNTGVDSVRELRENVRYLPSNNRHKIYIIDEVHMLSSAAFNALLKTLEEPPAHVKFIFATTEPHKIPVTIFSRCQRFDFRRVSLEQLHEHVRGILQQEGVTLDDSVLAMVVREAQGSVRDALSLLEQVLSYSGTTPTEADVTEALGIVDRGTVFALVTAILRRDADAVLRLVADVDARGHDVGDLVGLLLEHFRDLTAIQSVKDPASVLRQRSPGELSALAEQAGLCGLADLHRSFAQLAEVAEDVMRSSIPRVSLEMGLLRLLEIAPVVDVATLLQRLDALLAAGEAEEGGALPSGASDKAVSSAPDPQPSPSAITNVSITERPHVRPADDGGDKVDDDAWRNFAARVGARKPALGAMLAHGWPLRFDFGGVTIGFLRGSVYWESVCDDESKNVLQGLVKEHFGQAVPLQVRAVDEAQVRDRVSLSALHEAESVDRREVLHERVMEHPAIRGTLEILGGEVRDIRDLTAEATSKE